MSDPTLPRPRRGTLARFPAALSPLLAAGAVALLTGALGGCGQSAAEKAPATAAPPAVAVEAVRPVRGDMAAIHSGTAPIEADAEARVVAKVGGEIRALLVEEGDRVRAGQVLARLDGDRLRLEVAQAAARLAKLERDHERQVELQKRGLVGAAALDDLRFELAAQRAAHEMARLQLSYTEIRAPLDGVVAERFVKVGNTIQPNDPVFRVVDPQPLVTHVHVPERELGKLSAGQLARVQVDAAGGAFDGRIVRIAPVVDAASGTFKVTLELADPAGRLKPGMFARVDIVYERRAGVLQVPRTAVVDGDEGPTVFVAKAGRAEVRRVRTGLANGPLVEIVAGIRDGDEVVVVGQNGLKAGTPVRVVGAPPAAGKPG